MPRPQHRLVHALRRPAQAAMDLLMPPVCNFCGCPLTGPGSQPMLCQPCQDAMLASLGPVCNHCSAPISDYEDARDCIRCRNRKYHFERALAMGIYRDQLREAVIRMKQRGSESLTLSVGHLLARSVGSEFDGIEGLDLLVPVPVHWSKRLRRGINGPDVLAEAVGAVTGLPVALGLLYCRRRTSKQGTLLPTERFANVRDAFATRRKFDISGAHILLIDDIMTTGATGSEAAKTLRRAGAERVTLAVVARGVGQDRRVG